LWPFSCAWRRLPTNHHPLTPSLTKEGDFALLSSVAEGFVWIPLWGDGLLGRRTYTLVVLVVAAGCVHTSGLISIPKPGNSGTRTAPPLGIMGLFSMVGQVDS